MSLRNTNIYYAKTKATIQSPLARALGIKSSYLPRVIDATAGWGRDAFAMASLGCEVLLLERSPEVARRLRESLIQAKQDPKLEKAVNRMSLLEVDAILYLKALPEAERPDLIYLDPMYPVSPNASALAKKPLQLLRELVGEDVDQDELLLAALSCATKRVVVKRHRHDPPIGKHSPHHVISSKLVRFDVYMI